MAEQFVNMAQSALTGNVDAVTNPVNITVQGAAAFPTVGDFRILIDSEILVVTSVVTNTMTCVRAQEGTLIQAHTIGAQVTHILTAQSLTNIIADKIALIPATLPLAMVERYATGHTYQDVEPANPTFFEAALPVTAPYLWTPSSPANVDVPRTVTINPIGLPFPYIIGRTNQAEYDTAQGYSESPFGIVELLGVYFPSGSGTCDIGIGAKLGLPTAYPSAFTTSDDNFSSFSFTAGHIWVLTSSNGPGSQYGSPSFANGTDAYFGVFDPSAWVGIPYDGATDFALGYTSVRYKTLRSS